MDMAVLLGELALALGVFCVIGRALVERAQEVGVLPQSEK